MNLPSIGIIGNGFVGGAIADGFKHYVPSCKVYDVDPMRTVDNYFDTIAQDILFVCLPTPMKSNGRVDISIVDKALTQLSNALQEDDKPVIIKSTIPPEDLRMLAVDNIPELHLIYSPEFLTERTANLDFQQSNRLIFGQLLSDNPSRFDSVDRMAHNMEMINELFEFRFPKVPIIWTSLEEASLIKYFTNVFFATKISLFNEFALIAEQYGLVPDDVIGHVLLDQRIGRSHWQVPGHDGQRGFGGHCFPKDLNGYMHMAEDVEVDPLMGKATWVTNDRVRKSRDWEKDKGRAVSEDFEEK